MSLAAHYRQVLSLSQAMLAAGRAQAWADLIGLEGQRAALLANPPPTPPNVDEATDEIAESIRLIREIQHCDAELRDKLDAWMRHARILLRLDASPPLEP